jgi:hypothetical protein
VSAQAETAADDLVLTDDEVVAVSFELGEPWPGGLPTVRIDDPAALQGASFRGHRSLVVRGLLSEDGTLDESAAGTCSEIAGADTYLIAYLADEAFRPAGWGIMSGHYPSPAGWLFESVNPVGIHRLVRLPADDHRAYFEALLTGAQRSGPTPRDESAGQAAWLCVLSVAPGACNLAAARQGEVYAGPAMVVDGNVAEFRPELPIEAEAAVGRLLPTSFGAGLVAG